jgi:peptide-methionine (R)-S-oxide reductase
VTQTVPSSQPADQPVRLSEQEWKERLGPERYQVLRQKGTEPPWTGDLLNVHEAGEFRCAGCGTVLFRSEDKYDSGSGWPSFTREAEAGRVATAEDLSHGMVRTEILCSTCGGHLGHVFDDGPPPTGHRFCVNSLSLTFQPRIAATPKPDGEN